MDRIFLILLIFLSFNALASHHDPGWVPVGDMIVPESTLNSDGFSPFGFKEKKVRTWKKGVLPLYFDASVSGEQRKEFLEYCDEMGEFANVQCVYWQGQARDYVTVKIASFRSCGSSYLGRRGGEQDLKIRCWRKRTIQHELMHAFGVSHEHNRPDRDDFIKMNWSGIKSLSKMSYRKISTGKVSHATDFYDFQSIMHYDSRSGVKSGQVAFVRRDNNEEVRQTQSMSYGDHLILYKLYGGQEP